MRRRFLTFTFSIIFFIWSVDWKSLPFVAESDRGALRPIAAANSKGKISDLEGAGPEAVKLYLKLAKEKTDYIQIKIQLTEFLTPAYSVSPQESFQEFLKVTANSIADKTKAEIFRENIIGLLEGIEIEKVDSFLDDFRHKRPEESLKERPFISTDEVLKGEKNISIMEMLRRYSEAHMDILPDPNEVLVIIKENNNEIILDNYYASQLPERNYFKKRIVGPGEYYWVLYRYPCFKLKDSSLIEQDFGLDEWAVTDLEKVVLDDELESLGRRCLKKGADWEKSMDKWIDGYKYFCGVGSDLDAVKKLLSYFGRAFRDIPLVIGGEEKERLRAIIEILKVLMKEPEVENWITGFVISSYINKNHMKTYEDDVMFKKLTYKKEFELLLSILIDRGSEEIIPIAIHTFMYRSYNVNEGDEEIDRVTASILKSKHHQMKKAVFFKFLDNSKYPELLIKRSFGGLRYGIYTYDKSFIQDIYEMLRYFSFILPREQLEEFWVSHLIGEFISTKFAVIFEYLFTQETNVDLINLLLKEDNPRVRKRLSLLIDHKLFCKKFFCEIALDYYKSAAQRWIDLAIHFATKYNMPLKDWYGLAKVAKAFPDYRKEELQRWIQGQLQQAEVKVKAAQSLICNSPAISAAFSASA